MMHDKIVIQGLKQNNLKNISLEIPKEKIVVFTGVSGSGKSSIVFDTIAAESQRQMNETYSAWIRGRLEKYEKPKVEKIENLSASVIVDQSRLGGNSRSTVGTISDMYSALRLLFSRIGQPYVGTASYFSFNDPNGMCPECFGIGKVMTVDYEDRIDPEKTWMEGMADLPAFHVGNWYWKKYEEANIFPLDKKWKDFTETERNRLLYGADTPDGKRISKQVEGVANYLNKMLLNRDTSLIKEASVKRMMSLVSEKVCPVCHGKRLNEKTLSCKVAGYDISEMCEMEFSKLVEVLKTIDDPRAATIVDALVASLTRMIDIGLPYLSMNRESSTLSGGEAQRLKLVRYMGSALTGMTYIFDEPSTGMHPRDVHRMTNLLKSLRDRGNTVLVVEHDKDVISIADEVIDVGPLAGKNGGQILFQGSYESLLVSGTLTGEAMKQKVEIKKNPRAPREFLPIRNACKHNLKNVSVDIPVTFLGIFDEIRKVMAEENHVNPGLFSFNSKGACPVCGGKGMVVTELVFMDPVTTVCEACEGKRYSKEALSYQYRGKNIQEILSMSASDAYEFFRDHKKISKYLKAMIHVGLDYLSLGQPVSTLSGGERQRLKLAKYLDQKGNIYVLDEPTTGLHASDVGKIMELLESLVDKGNTVIVIEHNIDVMKQADYIIDIGPDGGSSGGEVVFTGTVREMMEHGESITAKYIRRDD